MVIRKTKERVLEVKPGSLELCGIEVFLLNVLPKLSDYQLTLLCMGGEKDAGLRERFEDYGIEVICKGIERKDGKYYHKICGALEEELTHRSYGITHIHGSLIGNTTALCGTARHVGSTRVIAHSHNITPIRPRVKGALVPALRAKIVRNADAILACSKKAGENFFGTKEWRRRGVFVPNGIEIDKFSPSSQVRGTIRGADTSSFIVGQVGRLVDQKNCLFTIDVFAELKKLVPESKLWLLGDGELRKELEHKVDALGLGDSVEFFGGVMNAELYYQDMDAFIMPSKYEGLGIVLVEAQASGLPCLISDRVPDEARLEGCCVEVLPLSDDSYVWARKLASFRGFQRGSNRGREALAGFSIDAAARRIEEAYDGLLCD